MNKPLALVIEDNKQQVNIFTAVLRYVGFKAGFTTDGQAALELLAGITPDLVTVDLHIPEISGASIIEYIRNEERLEKTKIVLSITDSDNVEGLREQVDTVLVKPYGIVDLHQVAQKLHPLPTN